MTPFKFDDVALCLRAEDDVAVVKRALSPGAELTNGTHCITLANAVPAGHKFALRSIKEGAPLRKYGQIIGFASAEISAGQHVHSHNLVMRDFGRAYEFGTDIRPVDFYPPEQMRTFGGYLRPDGRVGTRNYIAVISSVNCSASVSQYVKERFKTAEFQRDFPNVDGVIAFTHKSGCAVQPGEPYRMLQRVLAGIAKHPNIFGYVMIGLGCEGNQVQFIAKNHKLEQLRPGEPAPTFMNIQNIGGIRKTVDAASEAVKRLLPQANAQRRSPQPVSKLILAENCGGSDGASGITANPALGIAADELIRFGGTAVLAETPEIYGGEHLLTRRAISKAVGEKLVALIHWWEEHVRLHNASIDNNPSYGNKEGGLTTIFEKSLGAIAKGGQMPLMEVYKYAEPITAKGFCFMDTPGFDPVSMTGLITGGCNIGVFTTGRGSVYGCKPTPCIKIATNTALFNHMNDDMDLNAGTILDGTESVEQVGMRIFETIVAVANGTKTKSELAGIGDEEFAPWILGPTF